ncbi:hypothetical protein FN846DRAFT_1008849 [Sphaerosporella brunnea]|uniref:Protein BIG1 n=1 Tax=Sphaerosporella brunnea TaxID=1250544 RepID=A0A5J5F2A8_9PEZI|nr:hypothetical protein FN846DRAFT_1008849 [Sphaerosporella brunnea]
MWSLHPLLLAFPCLWLFSLFALSSSAPTPIVLVPTPIGGQKKCEVQRQSRHSQQSDESLLSPRDCAGEDFAPSLINYWSFYPYTTAIRSLLSDERRFFGPLGYHTRDSDQRASDQTYLWYLPRKTKTVKATETVVTAAVTETLYLLSTTTATETTTLLQRTTATKTATKTATVYVNRKFPFSGQKEPFTGLAEPLEHAGRPPRHSTAVVLQDAHPETLGHWPIPSQASYSLEAKRVPRSENKTPLQLEVDLRHHRKQVEGEEKSSVTATEELFSLESPKRSHKELFFSPAVLSIAQITGFIIVGLVLSTLLVVLFMWCSHPLWIMSDRWWALRPDLQVGPEMYGAHGGTAHGQGIAAPNNTGRGTSQRSTPRRGLEFVTAITSPGAVDGASSSEGSAIVPLAAVSTGSQTVGGNIARRSPTQIDISSLNGGRSFIRAQSRPYVGELFLDGTRVNETPLDEHPTNIAMPV